MKDQRVSGGVAILSAVLASTCCLGPLALSAIGVAGAGFAAGLAPYRAYFLLLTAGALGFAFYRTYRRPRPAAAAAAGGTGGGAAGAATAASDCCTTGAARHQKLILWIIAALAIGISAYPYIAGISLARDTVATAAGQSGQSGQSGPSVVLEVTGMTCTSCELHVEEALREVPGVVAAEASCEEGRAVVRIDPASEAGRAVAAGGIAASGIEPLLEAAVAATGYRATVATGRGGEERQEARP